MRFVQVAGILARRIVCYVHRGDQVQRGEIFGTILFGSRVDIYLPRRVVVRVRQGGTRQRRQERLGSDKMIRRKKYRKKRRRAREGVRRGVYILPNLLTSGCLVGGFYAIVAAFNGDYIIAAIAIMIAFFFDGVDGRVARLTKTTSRFGVEFDSLADLVAFGVAPGILVFTWALQPFGRVGWLAAFLYVACGALRLARFNVQVGHHGVPIFPGAPDPDGGKYDHRQRLPAPSLG